MSKKVQKRDLHTAPNGWRVVRFEPFEDGVSEDEIKVFPLVGWVVDNNVHCPAYWWNATDERDPGMLYTIDGRPDGFVYRVIGPDDEVPSARDLEEDLGYGPTPTAEESRRGIREALAELAGPADTPCAHMPRENARTLPAPGSPGVLALRLSYSHAL